MRAPEEHPGRMFGWYIPRTSLPHSLNPSAPVLVTISFREWPRTCIGCNRRSSLKTMTTKLHKSRWIVLAVGLLMSARAARSQDNDKMPSSYAPVDIHESFSTIRARMSAAKPEIMKRHMALLEQRYDLSNRPAQEVK